MIRRGRGRGGVISRGGAGGGVISISPWVRLEYTPQLFVFWSASMQPTPFVHSCAKQACSHDANHHCRLLSLPLPRHAHKALGVITTSVNCPYTVGRVQSNGGDTATPSGCTGVGPELLQMRGVDVQARNGWSRSLRVW